jgi:hypothetical protein
MGKMDDIDHRVAEAVAHYWKTRAGQRQRQETAGKLDQGLRSAVTGGAQMDGFVDLFTAAITLAGIPEQFIFRKKAVELPGYFRPTKEWDLLVVRNNTLIAALEAKSPVGPSFGDNFSNRTERRWGAPSTCGQRIESAPFSKAHRRFSGTSSCWKTATRPIVPSVSSSLTSGFFPTSSARPICDDTSYSAADWFLSATTPRQRLLRRRHLGESVEPTGRQPKTCQWGSLSGA